MSNSRPRLLVLAPTFPYPPISGGDIRTYHILRGLALAFDVELLTPSSGDIEQLTHQTGIRAAHSIESPHKSSVINRPRLNFWRYAPHNVSLDVDPAFARSLSRLVNEQRFDGILIDHLYMTQYARYAVRVPLFYSATDVETVKFARWHGNTPLKLKRRILHVAQQQVVRWHESRLSRRFRVVFTTSDVDRQFLERLNKGGFFISVPNGVDLQYFVPRQRASLDGLPAVFFVGTMYYKPNHQAALSLIEEVLPRIRAELPSTECHVVGKTGGEDYSALHDPKRSVYMHGFVDDVRPYIQKAQILVAPLSVGSGTRIKILETMASGTAVVSSSIGAEGIEYTDGENIVIADGPQETADAVVTLLRDRDRCFRIGQAGRRLVERKYAWDASVAIMRSEILKALPRARVDSR
jgi:glycosyltransferase involved in cell wall biosynthesis